MAENDNKCPLCGKNTNEGEPFCDDCQEIAQNAYPEELLSYGHSSESVSVEEVESDNVEVEYSSEEEDPTDATIEDTPLQARSVRSNKKLFIFVGIGLILMILIGGIGSYNLLKIRDAEDAEVAYWNKCIEDNSPLGYSKYLVRYPEGKYSAEAQDKIVELREKERNEWEALHKSGNVDALFSFLANHPQTPYERQIKHVVDSLSWIQAAKQNTAAAYQAYIDNVKIGRYAGEYEDVAKEKYDYLSQLIAVEGDELTDVEKALSNFFKALSSVNSKEIQKYSASVLLKFIDMENQSNTTIADTVKADFKINKIKNRSYILPFDFQEVIIDNKGIYFTTLVIKSETTFTDRKKKKEISEQILNIELDREKRIRSVYLKGK